MPRLKIYLTYDGTSYNGWQRQKNTATTIQEILENKLSRIANTRVSVMSSGRTDAGVHARIQVAHATVPEAVLKLLEHSSPVPGESRLKQGLNSLLPPDIRILRIEHVADEFHALRDVTRKTYLYFIDPSPVQMPELRRYAWNLRLPLDWNAMEQATAPLVGRHDFKAFCGAGSDVKTTVRTLYEATWGTMAWHGVSHSTELRVLRLTGSGFLRNMVRSVAGTLVHIGNGKAKPGLVAGLLETGDRKLAGPTAPPHGLWLWDILYKSA